MTARYIGGRVEQLSDGAGVGARGGRVARCTGRTGDATARTALLGAPRRRSGARQAARADGRRSRKPTARTPGCWSRVGDRLVGSAAAGGGDVGRCRERRKTRRVSDSADVTVPCEIRRVALSRTARLPRVQWATRALGGTDPATNGVVAYCARWRGNTPGHPAVDLDFSHRSRDKGESRVDHVLRRGRRQPRVARTRALQHRPGRVRQAPGRQAGDDPRALRRHGPRGALGRAAGALEPLRQRAARARGAEGRPRGDAAAADARDRRGVLRHLEVRGDPALDVGALRRRRHPPPRERLAGEGARHQRGQPGPGGRGAGRAGAAARRRAAGERGRRVRARGHARRGPGAALLHERHDRARQGHRPRAPVPARARGVHLLPRRAGRRALPRHGRVGVGGGHRAAARAVALRRRPARLPARGRVRPAQAARLPVTPSGRRTSSRRRPRCAR